MATRRTALPIHRDFIWYHGNAFVFAYIVKDANDTPMNNTDWRVDIDVRTTLENVVIQRFSTLTGEITLGGADGKVTWRVPREEVNTYPPWLYRFDIRETYSGDTGKHRYRGSIKVEEMSTREP